MIETFIECDLVGNSRNRFVVLWASKCDADWRRMWKYSADLFHSAAAACRMAKNQKWVSNRNQTKRNINKQFLHNRTSCFDICYLDQKHMLPGCLFSSFLFYSFDSKNEMSWMCRLAMVMTHDARRAATRHNCNSRENWMWLHWNQLIVYVWFIFSQNMDQLIYN